MRRSVKCIAHISDLHFGRLDAPIAEQLAAQLLEDPPTLLVISGDLTQRARVAQYREAAEYLKGLPGPQLVIPGNHDVPLWNLFRRFFAPTRRYQQHISNELNPVWSDDGMIVAGLNTARGLTRTSGWISREQLDFVYQTFANAQPSLRKVLVTHHPFIPSPRRPGGDVLIGAAEALTALERCGVDLVLAGHLHLAYHADVRVFHGAANRSVLSIQAGTATSTRRRGEPNAYNRIYLDGDDVRLSVQSWNGARFEQTTQKVYRRIQGIWRIQNVPAQAV